MFGYIPSAGFIPTSGAAGGGGGASDHGALTGLGDDDHSQYLLVDGTRAMTGAIDMGGFAVTNVGNVDGRDVSADGALLDARLPSANEKTSLGQLDGAAQGTVFYAASSTRVTRLAPGTSGQFLQTAGAAANPSWVTHGTTGDPHTQYLLADGTRTLTGNIAASSGITIDGRDISADGALLDARLPTANEKTDIGTLAGGTQGDVYYVNSSSRLARLAAGTSGQILKTQGAGANPTWVTHDSTGDPHTQYSLVDGTRAFTGGISGTSATFSGAVGTGALTASSVASSGAVSGTSASWTAGSTSTRTAVATGTTDGTVVTNSTAAAVGAQQYSPVLRLTGNGWGTTGGASQQVDMALQTRPVQGTTATGALHFLSQIAAGGYSSVGNLTTAGALTISAGLSATTGAFSAGVTCTTLDGSGVIGTTASGTSSLPAVYVGTTAYGLYKTGTSTAIAANGSNRLTLSTTVSVNANISVTSSQIGFFGAATAAQQTSGANLTNNVTSGGTTDQVDNWTDLSTYATDAAAIRNAVYQLARKLKQVNDGLRALGLFT